MPNFCSNCGATVNGGNFCSNCGYRFTQEAGEISTNASIEDINSIFTEIAEMASFSEFEYEKRNDGTFLIKRLKDKYATHVVVPNGTSIIGEGAFMGTSVISVELPEGVRIIDTNAFANCKHLKNLNIPSSVVLVEAEALLNCEKLLVSISSETELGKDALKGTLNEIRAKEAEEEEKLLSQYKLEKNPDGTYAIVGANDINVTILKIPKSVTVIKARAFGGWNEKVCKQLKEVVFQEGLVSIEDEAFAYCEALEEVMLPASLENLGARAFSACDRLVKISVNPDNQKYYSKDNCVIEKQSKTLVLGCNRSIIPNDGSVVTIGKTAFSSCKQLTTVIIPDSVTSIEAGAFENNTSLTNLKLSKNLKKLGCNAFSAVNVESFELSECLTEIEDTILNYCSVDKVVVPGSISTIPKYCFNYSKINRIIIRDGVKEIKKAAFYVCEGIDEILLPDTITKIEDEAFASCIINKLVIPKNVKKLEGKIFQFCEINELVFQEGIEKIKDGLFYYNDYRVKRMYLPKSLTELDKLNLSWNSNIEIFCAHESKPSGWADDWCPSENAKVHWGYKY